MSDQLSILKGVIKRLGFVSDEKISLFGYFTGNEKNQTDALSLLDDCDTDEERRKYLRSLISPPEPGAEPLSKRIKVEDENLSGFWQALKNVTIKESDDFFELPDGIRFLGRRDEASILFIRKCYRDLLGVVLSDDIRRLIITGNPGIGKTFFSYLVIYELMKKNATVIYDKVERFPILFNNQTVAVYENLFSLYDHLYKQDVWYIVDGKKPQDVDAKTILICSPKKSYFVEFDKNPLTTTRYMPVWDKSEIDTCWNKIYKNEVSKKTVDELFYKWGGIPRFVLERTNENTQQAKLKEAIDACDESLLIASIGGTDSKPEISHKLIHIITNLPIDEGNEDDENNRSNVEDEVQVEYVEEEPPYTQKIIKFASEHVSQRVIMNFEKSIMSKLRTELNVSLSNGISNPVLGSIFEEIAHKILQNGGSFKIRSLDDSRRYDQTINKRDKIDTFSTIETITNGKYFRPDNKNFPSIDSVIAPGKLFQMTTAMNHPIKMVGLKKVYAKLAKTGEIMFFFVVPAQLFDCYKKQKFVTTDNNNATKMPPWIKNRVKQYVLKIDLAELDEGDRSSDDGGGSSDGSSSHWLAGVKKTLKAKK